MPISDAGVTIPGAYEAALELTKIAIESNPSYTLNAAGAKRIVEFMDTIYDSLVAKTSQ